MPEGLFSPLHLMILIFAAIIVFGIPLLLVFLLFLLARLLDKRMQRRPGVRVSIASASPSGSTPSRPAKIPNRLSYRYFS